MILDQIRRFAVDQPDQPFVLDSEETLSFQQIGQRARQMGHTLVHTANVSPGSTVYLHVRDSCQAIALLLATQCAGARACVLSRSLGADDLWQLSQRLQQGILVTDTEATQSWPGKVYALQDLPMSMDVLPQTETSQQGGIVILTTGTTGIPKAVFYTWERLLAQVRLASTTGNGMRWALLYPLNHFAGLQVLLHAAKNGLALAIPRSRHFADVLECMVRHKIDSVSATPTFWRMFTGQLTAAQAAQISLRQITLGGEPATGDILERLRHLFPHARVTHVYATTEIGSCFAVSDGKAGFPTHLLESPIGNVHLKVHEGQLYVQTAVGMVHYIDGSPAPRRMGDWIATGDMVEIRDDRVIFLGRESEIINVGGVKVYPPTVEAQIRKVDGVRDVRVYGKANPITGQIVAAELEISADIEPKLVLAAVRQACQATLSRYEQPREMRIVTELTRSNEKLVRK